MVRSFNAYPPMTAPNGSRRARSARRCPRPAHPDSTDIGSVPTNPATILSRGFSAASASCCSPPSSSCPASMASAYSWGLRWATSAGGSTWSASDSWKSGQISLSSTPSSSLLACSNRRSRFSSSSSLHSPGSVWPSSCAPAPIKSPPATTSPPRVHWVPATLVSSGDTSCLTVRPSS